MSVFKLSLKICKVYYNFNDKMIMKCFMITQRKNKIYKIMEYYLRWKA